MIGRTLDDRYTITGRVGKGSMGTVYRARQNVMDRDVAIKILRQDRAVDDSSKARFFREAKAQSVLHSPHTVTVFDFGQTSDEELYLAMELLEGESLGQRLARVKRFTPADAIETTRQVLRSLGEAHTKGIIHRDLKPDNIFFARVVQGASDSDSRHDEIVKVLDFGIAKLTAVGATAAGEMNAVETQAGTVFGTPRYMSPEQAQGKPLDARTDLYSLGVMLYQMLAGRPPFTDTDAVVVMARHIRTNPKTLREVAPDVVLPADLEQLVLRVLSKDPNERPANAEAMTAALQHSRETLMAQTSGVRPSVNDISDAMPESVPGGGPASTDFATRPLVSPPPVSSAELKQSALDTLGSAAYDAAGTGRRGKFRLGVGIVMSLVALVAIVGFARLSLHPRAPVLASSSAPSTASNSTLAAMSTASGASAAATASAPLTSAPMPSTPTPSGTIDPATPAVELDNDDVPTVAVTSLAPATSGSATSTGPHGGSGRGGNGARKPHPPHSGTDKPPSSYGLFE